MQVLAVIRVEKQPVPAERTPAPRLWCAAVSHTI
jgi:hypothetical protein